jgi:hypothetical protein
MYRITSNLGNTGQQITVDLDSVQVSYGADTDDIHCWTCVTADLGDGVYIVKANLRDGRLDEPERWYHTEVPGQERFTKTLICCDCAIKHGYGNAKRVETVAQRTERLTATHGLN